MNKKTTKLYFKTGILFFICLFSLPSFSQTFDWENAVDNGDNVTQTVSGVTATVTTNIITSITDNITVLSFWNNGSGTSGKTVFTPQFNNSNSITVTFSAPIDIATIYAFDADRITGTTWTFTPTGGSSTAFVQAIQNDMGTNVAVNWTAITSFTITSAQGNDTFGIDDIAFATTLSIEDYDMRNAISIYPNPTSDFINISGLKEKTVYNIFNVLGESVLKGTASKDNPINIREFRKGLYFIRLEDTQTLKFIKK